MKLQDLTGDHIGANITVTIGEQTMTGIMIGHGWGSTGDEDPQGVIKFYGNKSITIPIDVDCITINE